MNVKQKIGRFFSCVSSSMRRPVIAEITDVPLSKLLLEKKVLICATSNSFRETVTQKCSEMGAETVLIDLNSNCMTTLSELAVVAQANNEPFKTRSVSTVHTEVMAFDCVLFCLDNCYSCDDLLTDASVGAYGDHQNVKEIYFVASCIVSKMLARKRPTSVVFLERTNDIDSVQINEAILSGFTIGLAKELRATSIRVNHVIMDVSNHRGCGNNSHDSAKKDDVDVALPLVMFLLSDVSACMTGQCIRQQV